VERERRSVKAVADSIVADEPGGRWGGWVRGSECELSREGGSVRHRCGREDEETLMRWVEGDAKKEGWADGKEEVGWRAMGEPVKGAHPGF
jgi:hypothetical protein